MVPNPVSGLETVGIVHCAPPCPCVQSVGAVVTPAAIGLQICQNTVVAEAPETLAPNCTELFTSTDIGDAPELATVTATGVEFELQPAAKMARSITTPNPHTFMCFPPTIATPFSLHVGQRPAHGSALALPAVSLERTAHCETQRPSRFEKARRNRLARSREGQEILEARHDLRVIHT